MFNASEVYYVLEDLFGQKEKPNFNLSESIATWRKLNNQSTRLPFTGARFTRGAVTDSPTVQHSL